MSTQQEKVAAVQERLYNDIYLPALVHAYNEKAASAGIDPISTEAELEQALNLVGYIEQHRQASQGDNPLTKAASLLQPGRQQQQASRDNMLNFAKHAATNEDLLRSLIELSQATE